MMTKINEVDLSENGLNPNNLLMLLLPFWTPLTPPMGICTLKSYLEPYGYHVRTADGNTNPKLWELNRKYFDTLKEFIPVDKQGNFYNIGYNVLRNHLMAYINNRDQEKHIELVKILVRTHYYCDITSKQVDVLDEILKSFYSILKMYILDLLEQEKPRYLGISVFSGTLAPSLFAFQVAKEKYPDMKTVMGGGVFADQLTMGSPDFDYLVEKTPYIDKFMVGEGYNIWLKYLRGELPEQQKVYSIKDINSEVVDIACRILPDHSDVNVEYYPYLSATGSKSCPFHCSFCNVSKFWGEYRQKEPKQTVSEMLDSYKKDKAQLFFMTDSLLNPIIDNLSYEFRKSNTRLYWDGYLRAAEPVCNIDNTLLWRRGGFYRARMGVESGSQHVLDLMGKKITPELSMRAISSLAYAGIKTTVYIVIGHPGETEEDFQKTLDMIENIKDDIWEAECNPFLFFYTGQANSDDWSNKRKLLYPEWAREILISQTWIYDGEPSREVVYDRVFRFVEHCNKLGIPNPYTLQETYAADERWKKLHRNAVPSVVELEDRDKYIDDTEHVQKLLLAKQNDDIEEDFDF
ncbi:MAG: radical SAM protein [Herbinix sp.]|nr:radical SAM protein [Herbinix sp.]